MSFLSRITRLPHAYEPELGNEVRTCMPGLPTELGNLLTGAAGSSPYLKSLIEKEADWLPAALDDPEAALSVLFDEVRATSPGALPVGLRQAKRRVALITGLADLAGVWPLETVTGVLSDFAGLAVDCAMKAALAHEIHRGKLVGMTDADLDTACGMVALAMGKMGARELNYSSDIDLICLFDETRFDPDDYYEIRSGFVRATRKWSAMLNDITSEGYVFRTDLRLRPDPSVTPVCIAMEAAERYYESLGRTWERAAYVKARPAAGDTDAGERFLTALTPFVWRKHLDFAAIEDAHNMRLAIRDHKGLHGPVTLPGHDMKLGRGGIREIEFFTQTRQIIAGGRDPDLRVRGTVDGLATLADKGWIPPGTAAELTEHYRFHREVEHRLQMLRDAQTHTLPNSGAGFDRLAAFMGQDRAALESELTARLNAVHDIIEGFFAPAATAPMDVPAAPETGFDANILSKWTSYPALRSERAVEIFDRLKPGLLDRLSKAPDPHEALIAFDGFLSGLPAGVQVFSLFDANPQLVDLLVDIVSSSGDLAQYLSRNSQVFDAVIGGDFFAEWPGAETLEHQLTGRLGREEDYERKLDAARRWLKEWHFRVGVHMLRGLLTPDQASVQYAELAQAVLRAVWPAVVDQFAVKYGAPPGRGAAILGMGSLGAGRLNATSDLDLIVIYDAQGQDTSDGPRPLASRTYYARLTQTLITALTAPMAEGKLYEVDMRLRPSGNKGPVATGWTSFTDYQRNEAWVWEHLALTRARVIAGAPDLGADISALRRDLIAAPRDPAHVVAELVEMRRRLAEAKASAGPWDAKQGPGRLMDIELLAQACALLARAPVRDVDEGLAAGVAIEWLSTADQTALSRSHAQFSALLQVSKLLTNGLLDPEKLGQGGCQTLLAATGHDTIADLATDLTEAAKVSETIILRLMSAPPDGQTNDIAT